MISKSEAEKRLKKIKSDADKGKISKKKAMFLADKVKADFAETKEWAKSKRAEAQKEMEAIQSGSLPEQQELAWRNPFTGSTYEMSPQTQKDVKMFFPRATKDLGRDNLQRGASAYADVSSLPGRVLSGMADVMTGTDETLQESITRTGEEEDSSILGSIARAPGMIETMAAGGPLANVSKGVARGIASPVGRKAAEYGLRGAMTSAPMTATGQIEQFGETGEVSPGEVAGELALGAATEGALGTGVQAGRKILPYVKDWGKDVLSWTSGTSKDLLEKVGAEELTGWMSRKLGVGKGETPNIDEIRNFQQEAKDFGGEFVRKVENMETDLIGSDPNIKATFDNMGAVDLSPVVEELQKLKKLPTSIKKKKSSVKYGEKIGFEEDKFNQKIDDVTRRIAGDETPEAVGTMKAKRVSDFMDQMDNYQDNLIIENESIMNAVDNMGDIDIAPVLDKLNDLKKPISGRKPGFGEYASDELGPGFEKTDAYNHEIDRVMNYLSGGAKSTGEVLQTNLGAKDVLDLRREIDANINWNENAKGALNPNEVGSIQKNTRNYLKDLLEDAAVKTGNKEYVSAMKDMHKKLSVRDKIESKTRGKTDEDTYTKVYQMFETIDDPKNAMRKEIIKDVEQITGGNFLNDTDFMEVAAQNAKNINSEDAFKMISEIKESPQLGDAGKKAVGLIWGKLKDRARATGGKKTVKDIESLGNRQKVKNDLMKLINSRFESDPLISDRGEAALTLMGKRNNRDGYKEFMKLSADLLGDNRVFRDAKLERLASEYGEKLPLLNQMSTGASLRGLAMMGGLGGGEQGVGRGLLDMAPMSPKVAAPIVGAMDAAPKAIRSASDVVQQKGGVSPMQMYQALRSRGVSGMVGE